MKKLRIGILGTRGIPNHYGGFEQFAEHLSAGLAKRGHDASVYNSSLHPYKESHWNGVRIIHCRDWEHKLGTAGQFFYDLNCINDSSKRNFDVLLHLGYNSDSIWHWRWPSHTVNLVNMDGLEWMRSKYNKPTQRFLRWAESLAARKAHTMIADSPGIQKYLAAKYNRKPVYIPYGATGFNEEEADASILLKYNLTPGNYDLLIARMEPENNIEMIIRGHLKASPGRPLFIIGNITNKFGKYITSHYHHPSLKFSDAIYDLNELNNLRFFSAIYYHGHSVGGTNPSLLEAMACGCRIAAHDNRFNRAVLGEDADYFQSDFDIAEINNRQPAQQTLRRERNLEKIVRVYSDDKIIDSYEELMLGCCGKIKMVIPVEVEAEAV